MEANKALVHRFSEELWNERNVALADNLFAEDCVTHQLRFGNDPTGAPRGPALKSVLPSFAREN